MQQRATAAVKHMAEEEERIMAMARVRLAAMQPEELVKMQQDHTAIVHQYYQQRFQAHCRQTNAWDAQNKATMDVDNALVMAEEGQRAFQVSPRLSRVAANHMGTLSDPLIKN